MRNQGRQPASRQSSPAGASTATPQNTVQSGTWASRSRYLLLILLLASVSSASHAVRQVGQDDTSRKIYSTDFTNSRKEGATHRTKSKSGGATKPRSYRLASN